MLKKFFAAVCIFFSITISYASYLKNVPQTITQPNGKQIHCFASGDEYHNWLHDSAGYTIILDEKTGYYTYAQQAGDALMASTYIVGEVNPFVLGLQVNVNISEEKWIEKRKAFQSDIPFEPERKTSGKNHGHINNLVFFIRFSDESGYNGDIYTTIVNKFNDSSTVTANSLYNYYRHVSYGKLFVTSHFYPTSNSSVVYSFQDSFPRKYYLAYNATTNPIGYKTSTERRKREHALLQRTVLFFEDSIPSSLNLDYDNNGRVDNVCFVTSGSPEGWSGLMWPHRWSLYTYDVSINGKRVYDYNFIMETYMYSGIITHEFMHTLGAPDLYRYDETYDYVTPVGSWDLMASTSYSKPQGLGAYMKLKYGNWIDSIPTIYKGGTYTLFPANGSSPNRIAYKIPIENEPNQFIILEYRKKTSTTFESGLSGSGILIYRIDDRYNGNAGYDGDSTLDEVYIFRPDGTTTSEGYLSLAYFSEESGRTTFNDVSNPSPFLSNGGNVMGISISNITSAIDSIRFTIGLDTTTLAIDTNYMLLTNDIGYTDTFRISSNDSWYIAGDTNWFSLSVAQSSGDAEIIVSTKTKNSTTLQRYVELSVISTTRIKTITVAQDPLAKDDCVSIHNLFETDTFVELAFPYADTNNYIRSASEYINVYEEVIIDSVAVYFGNLNLTANDTVVVRITNTSSLRTPTTLYRKMNILGDQIISNAWNMILLDEPLTISRHFCVDYILPGEKGDPDSARFVFVKNASLRNKSLATGYIRVNLPWQQPGIYTGDNNIYALPVKVYVCPTDLAIKEVNITKDGNFTIFPNPANENINIRFEGMEAANASIHIYSVNGQVLYTQSSINTQEVQSINISHLPAGMYFIKLSTSGFSKVKPFIVE